MFSKCIIDLGNLASLSTLCSLLIGLICNSTNMIMNNNLLTVNELRIKEINWYLKCSVSSYNR